MNLYEIKMLAESGFSDAQYLMGIFNEHGFGCEKNLNCALEWYKKSAIFGYSPAEYALSNIYAEENNYDEANEWCLKSANSGYPIALYQMALVYRIGVGVGVEKNQKIAMEYLIKAGQAGYVDAMLELGYLYYEVNDNAHDLCKSFYWFEKLAQCENGEGTYMLAGMYEMGEGIKMDVQKAFNLYKKAADFGSSGAHMRLAFLYAKGINGASLNIKKSKEHQRLFEVCGDIEDEDLR